MTNATGVAFRVDDRRDRAGLDELLQRKKVSCCAFEVSIRNV
jgi:hypothetical protein